MDGEHEPLTASEVSSWSRLSSTAGNPDLARVIVQLSNGTKLLIPISQTATVRDLHEKALNRAAKFGYHVKPEGTFLQTSGSTAVALCEEDSLRDVWDLTENSTFTLLTLQDYSFSMNYATPSLHTPTLTSSVAIRLITLEEAIVSSKLISIDKDLLTVPDNMSLAQIYATITTNFGTGHKDLHDVHVTQPKINLYLAQCHLNAENNHATLHDLNLEGNETKPLHIFIDLDSSDPGSNVTIENLTTDTNLTDLWGFDVTRRGVSTLVTSLMTLLHIVKSKEDAFNSLLQSLFDLTHFPPLLIAFKSLSISYRDYKLCPSNLRMVACALQLICLQTAPAWICSSPEQALESSRQILAWIYSLKAAVPETIGQVKPVVRNVQIRDQHENNQPITLPYTFDIQIPTKQQSGTIGSKTVVLALDQDDKARAVFLGLAITACCSPMADYYLDPVTDWNTLFNQEKVSPPQIDGFDALLQITTTSKKFGMVSPEKLGSRLSSELPLITLSANGYVSIYDQEDYECSQRFFTWNPVDGKEIMAKGNPGQYLMQKLEPIVTERKKIGTWVTDAWDKWSEKTNFGPPDEAVVVCMDVSSSMATSMPVTWVSQCFSKGGVSPSRLTEVKEFFKNLASRMSALQLSTHLGLVTFSSKSQIEVKQDLTPIHLDFEDQVDGLKAQSSTALFDGIEKAHKMLVDAQKNYKGVRCRIVVLTDGEDNSSAFKPEVIASELYNDDVILDSIVIGTQDHTKSLFKISRHTGGYAFAPRDQHTFFQIFLLETMVDVRTRPEIVKVPLGKSHGTFAWEKFLPKTDDMATPYSFPPCRPHPNQDDYFIALKDAERFLTRKNSLSTGKAPSVISVSTRTTSTAVSGTTLNNAGGKSRIILNEIKDMIENPHPYVDVYVSESNMGFWKIALQGPPNSPYDHGVFVLYLDIGDQFPLSPPSVRFITPILHPNITKHGRICHPILNREWNGTTRVYQVLQHIWGLLMTLEVRDAVDPLFTLKFWTDPQQGVVEVKRYVDMFATKSRATIRADIIDGDSSTLSSSATSIVSRLKRKPSTAPSIDSQTTIAETGNTPTTPDTPNGSSPPRSQRFSLSSVNSRRRLLPNRAAPRPNIVPMMIAPGGLAEAPNSQQQTNAQTVTQQPTSGPPSDAGSRKSSRRRSFFNLVSKN